MKAKTKKPQVKVKPEGWDELMIQQATEGELSRTAGLKSFTSRTSNIVPFGRYKGQPVEVLTQDSSYVDWLTAQDWFRQEHKNMYTLIVNNFREPSETPEHNEVQAKFLDQEFCKWIIMAAIGRTAISVRSEFEDGSDVTLSYEYLTGRKRFKVDENRNVVYRIDKRGRKFPESEPETDIEFLRIEVKPSVGDDYPAVLRQITASRERHRQRQLQYENGRNAWPENKYPYVPPYGLAVLFLGSYTGVGVSEKQFRQIFARSTITVVFSAEEVQS